MAYSGTTGRVPRYICHGGRVERGSSSCLTIGGLRVDRAVEAAVLDAIQPAGVTAAVEALERLHSEHDFTRQALALAVEKARYEAQRAQRQYDRVEPDNRLVAGELERRWNETLTQVAEAEARLATLEGQPPTLSEEQHDALLTLSHDLATVWHHPAASEALKKRILRTVLHEIMIHTTQEPPEHVLHLHWHGGVHTEVRVARNTAGKHGRATDRDVIEVIRELSKVCRDLTIAATLNRLGYRTGTGKTWRAHSVACVRYQYRLPNFTKGHDWLTLTQAAQQLGVSATVVQRCIAQGTLPARQVEPPPMPVGVAGPSLHAGRSRARCRSAWGATRPHAAVRRAVMAAVRLSRLQTRILRWLAADEQRTRGMITSSHPELVAALPSAKGNISHSLRRLEAQGLIVMLRTPGGKTESVYLTAAGRQRAFKLTGSYE